MGFDVLGLGVVRFSRCFYLHLFGWKWALEPRNIHCHDSHWETAYEFLARLHPCTTDRSFFRRGMQLVGFSAAFPGYRRSQSNPWRVQHFACNSPAFSEHNHRSHWNYGSYVWRSCGFCPNQFTRCAGCLARCALGRSNRHGSRRTNRICHQSCPRFGTANRTLHLANYRETRQRLDVQLGAHCRTHCRGAYRCSTLQLCGRLKTISRRSFNPRSRGCSPLPLRCRNVPVKPNRQCLF